MTYRTAGWCIFAVTFVLNIAYPRDGLLWVAGCALAAYVGHQV